MSINLNAKFASLLSYHSSTDNVIVKMDRRQFTNKFILFKLRNKTNEDAIRPLIDFAGLGIYRDFYSSLGSRIGTGIETNKTILVEIKERDKTTTVAGIAWLKNGGQFISRASVWVQS
jgi:hypothetical protein